MIYSLEGVHVFQSDCFKGNKIHMEEQTLEMHYKVSVASYHLVYWQPYWENPLGASSLAIRFFFPLPSVLANMACPLEKAHLLAPFLLV